MHDGPIGQRLRAGGLISEADLTAAVHQQRRLRRKKLGAYLLELGGVPARVLSRAVREKRGLCIGEWLVTQGYVSPAVLACALTRQRAERAMRIGDILVEQGAISRERLELFLLEEAREAGRETRGHNCGPELSLEGLFPT
ncbi:MAG TPA: hypothetical protein PKA88_01710 [Polyangiaceae bacterium]|nr:hypothetical protein [Polyangiaceae bacterium]HMR77363.1 hypothetical protein [Polyangiaceae bacterium]